MMRNRKHMVWNIATIVCVVVFGTLGAVSGYYGDCSNSILSILILLLIGGISEQKEYIEVLEGYVWDFDR